MNNLGKASAEQLSQYILNYKSQPISIQDIIKSQARTLLVFVRHFNCFVCRDQIKALGSTIQQNELKNANTQIVVVACSKADAIQDFSKDTGFSEDYIYVNPDLKTYQAFGLERAKGFGDLKGNGGVNQDTTSGTLSGFAWSFWKTISRGQQGDVYQLGGEFLINSEGDVLFAKANKSSQDYLSAKEVRELLKL
ncbi:hypothetical protein pb186bvf_006293 [Paramecium bursaria]